MTTIDKMLKGLNLFFNVAVFWTLEVIESQNNRSDNWGMAIKSIEFPAIDEMLENLFQPETDWPTIILPSLDIKKQMVEKMVAKFGSIPDQNVLRLNEFFVRQISKVQPGVQFLDKELLALLLKQNLDQDEILKKYTPFIDVALDYISIFAPILGRPIYREALADFIEHDPDFLKNYGDLYDFLTQVWDLLLRSGHLLNSWALGWLFLEMPALEKMPQTIYILGGDTQLKPIEKEFFEELNGWDIYYVHIQSSFMHATDVGDVVQNQKAGFVLQGEADQNTNHILHVVSPIEEINFCIQQLNQARPGDVINIIVPKAKWYYKEILEIYIGIKDEPDLLGAKKIEGEILPSDAMSLREKIHSFLSPIKVALNKYSPEDLKTLLQTKSKEFKNQFEFNKNTSNLLGPGSLVELSLDASTWSVPTDILGFLNLLLETHYEQNEVYSEVLRKLYPVVVRIPKKLKLAPKDWLEFLTLKLDQWQPSYKSLEINFYTLEDMHWGENETNIFLSCTRNDYEKSLFAYLSDFEVAKIKNDLGFDLEGLSPAETFRNDLHRNSRNACVQYFLCPEFDLLGTSQQLPKFIQELLAQGAQELRNATVASLDKGLGLTDRNQCGIQNFQVQRLSYSQLQTYIDSPYDFVMKYILGLQSEETLDVDPSPLLSGQVFHKILERSLKEQKCDLDFIRTIIMEMITQEYRWWPQSRAAEKQISKYAQDILNYLERDAQKKLEQGRETLGLEVKFQAYFDLKDLHFYKDAKAGRVLFTGAIDRIDVVDHRAYIIDYKSSKMSVQKIRSIQKSPSIQMPLYAMIVQDGVLDDVLQRSNLDVTGLIYIAMKEGFEFLPAMYIKEHALDFLDQKPRAKAYIGQEQFFGILNEYRSYIASQILRLQHQDFPSYVRENKRLQLVELDF